MPSATRRSILSFPLVMHICYCNRPCRKSSCILARIRLVPKDAYMQPVRCESADKEDLASASAVDAFGNVSQGLEVGPAWELIVFRCRRDVCAHHVDREAGHICERDLGAVELMKISQCKLRSAVQSLLTLATLYCRLLAIYSSTCSGCMERISPAFAFSSKALVKGIVPVT